MSTSQSSSQANIQPHVMYEVEVYEVEVYEVEVYEVEGVEVEGVEMRWR